MKAICVEDRILYLVPDGASIAAWPEVRVSGELIFTASDGGVPYLLDAPDETNLGQLRMGNGQIEVVPPVVNARAHNEALKNQIVAIETRTSNSLTRALREAALGVDGAVARVQSIDNEIAALRAQFL